MVGGTRKALRVFENFFAEIDRLTRTFSLLAARSPDKGRDTTKGGESMKEIIKAKQIDTLNGGLIPLELIKDQDEDGFFYSVEVDGVEWFISESLPHATILFEMMSKHINEYMRYIST